MKCIKCNKRPRKGTNQLCHTCGKKSRKRAATWRDKNPERTKAARDRWRKANREKLSKDAHNSRAAVYRYLLTEVLLACVDCGCDDQRILEFDHVRGVKVASPFSGTLTRAKIEIEKCEVRCPNCHRLRHWAEGGDRRQGRRVVLEELGRG